MKQAGSINPVGFSVAGFYTRLNELRIQQVLRQHGSNLLEREVLVRSLGFMANLRADV